MPDWKFSTHTNKKLINASIRSYFIFLGILICSIYYYPGSHHKDTTTLSYSITHNFLSDLGLTIVYSGEQNFISSTLFVFATTLVCIGLVAYFLVIPSILNKGNISSKFAKLGSVSGIICGIAFMGVGFTPHNYYLDEHMFFVKLGFQLFLVVMLLHSLAILKNKVGLDKRILWVYFVFMGVLLFHIYLLNWGPSVNEGYGLVLKVVWQKVTVIGLSTTVFLQALIIKKYIHSLPET